METWVCNKALELHGVQNIKLRRTGERGWPDRMFLIPGGLPFFIEFKRVGGTPSKLQLLKLHRLKRIGYDAEIHDDRETALEAIRQRVLEATQGAEDSPEVHARARRSSVQPS